MEAAVFRPRGHVRYLYPVILSWWGFVPFVFFGPLPIALLWLVVPSLVTWLVARRKTMIVDSSGIRLGSQFYPVADIDRVETSQTGFDGQGRCHLVIRLVSGQTIPWCWISYMRSSFGILMRQNHVSVTNQRYLRTLSDALAEAGIAHRLIGADHPGNLVR